MENKSLISVIATISVKNLIEINDFIDSWRVYLDDNIELIVCVNNLYRFNQKIKKVKVVEFPDNRGMFQFKIQQKKYFAGKQSSSDFLFFIHDRITPKDFLFFSKLKKYLKLNKPDYLTFIIKNTDGSNSLSPIYMDMNSVLNTSFYSYLNNLKFSRGCVFSKNHVPSINGGAFLISKDSLNYINNNYSWGEMEDQKLTFDLFLNSKKGYVFTDDFLLTKVYKPSNLKRPSNTVLILHFLIRLVYYKIRLLTNYITIYSNIDYKEELFKLKKNKELKLIDFSHKPFHTTIYLNSLEKILTCFRSIDCHIDVIIEKKIWGYLIKINE